MVNKSDFELYLINNKSEKKSLMYHEFDLIVNNLKSKVDIEYEENKTYQYILNFKNNQLNDETIHYSGACSTSKRKKAFEDYLLKQKQGFKLYYKNAILKEEYYCFVDLISLESNDVDRYDEYEMEIEFKRVSNWIKEIPIDFNNNDEEIVPNWIYGEKRPVRYSMIRKYYELSTCKVINNGHEPSPFILVLPKGATNVKWYLINSDSQIVKDSTGKDLYGELNVSISERFVIDTYNSMIYSEFKDYSYLREKTKLNYFDIPIGEYSLVVLGDTSTPGGVMYEQYNKI